MFWNKLGVNKFLPKMTSRLSLTTKTVCLVKSVKCSFLFLSVILVIWTKNSGKSVNKNLFFNLFTAPTPLPSYFFLSEYILFLICLLSSPPTHSICRSDWHKHSYITDSLKWKFVDLRPKSHQKLPDFGKYSLCFCSILFVCLCSYRMSNEQRLR